MIRIGRITMQCAISSIAGLLFAMMLAACTPLLPQGKAIGPGTYKVPTQIRTGDFKRDYHVHIPPGYDGQQTLPMVVVVHGAFDTAKGMEKFSGFSDLADRENFIVLYPNGIGIFGFFQHWNAGHCCAKAQQDQIDDVGFVAEAIEQTSQRLHVDRRRIFMLGFSNGGMFTHRFAAEKSELLAGAAVLAGSIGSRTADTVQEWLIPRPTMALPFVIMHGTADTDVPFKGQASQRGGTPRFYRTVDESIAFWRDVNGCRAVAQTASLFSGAVDFKSWKDCTSGRPVLFYAINGWGHIWPGKYFTVELEENDPLKNFDAAELLWNFFKTLER